MKPFLLLICLLLFAAATFVNAQGVSVPKVISVEMAQRYPYAKNVVWSHSNTFYVATFVDKLKVETRVTFTPGGALVDVTTPTPVNYLPDAIPGYVKGRLHSAIASAHKRFTAAGKAYYDIKLTTGKTIMFDQDARPVNP